MKTDVEKLTKLFMGEIEAFDDPEIQEALEFSNIEYLLQVIDAYEGLVVHYRLGKAPSAANLDTIQGWNTLKNRFSNPAQTVGKVRFRAHVIYKGITDAK